MQHLFGPRGHTPFFIITFLGASAVLWALLALYYWWIDPRFARRLGVVFAVSILANHLLKALVGSPRPYDLDVALSTESARRTGGGHGFPSGHTQNAATFWLAFAFRYGWLWLWGLALLLVAAVGLSRMVLGVHMPVDVAGGFAFGAIFAWLAGASKVRLPPVELTRRVWGPVVVVGAVCLAFLAPIDPRVLGILSGCLLAIPDFEPPKTWKGRLTLAGGGIALVLLLGAGLAWLEGRLLGGNPMAIATAFARYLALTLLAAEGWPRLWSRTVRS
ncbi:MAG TPA: phosphatase PAP2 family protein [Thermoanaerobaculia bacterium]|nr:phosphatase PAP2 family protein [Thermoanaerobaculia bacterium]